MLVAVPIRIITNDEKTNKAFNKLPLDIQDYFINASDNFQQQSIIPLLESSEADFPKKFSDSALHLANYLMQIGSLFAEKEKTYPNLINDVLEFTIASVEAIKDQIESLPTNVSVGIGNSLEILLNYMMITSDPKMAEQITKPEYEPSIGYYLYLLLSISALVSISKYENKNYEQKIDILLQYTNSYTKELEEYVETMEIENSSEDMQILEKIKTE